LLICRLVLQGVLPELKSQPLGLYPLAAILHFIRI
jgi:hypothetical protein